MGQSQSLDFETDFLTPKSWTLEHVKELSQAWRDVLNMQFGINKAELHTLISSCSFANDKDFTELVSECWALFNPDDQKLIDTLGVVCTFGIECKGSFDDKIDFIFDTFDLNGNGQLNRDELTILCLATMLGLVRYIKPSLTPPSDEVCEEFSLKAFQAMDKDVNGSVSREEFHLFVKNELDTNSNEVISDVELMEYFGVVDDVNPDDESDAEDDDINNEAQDFDPLMFQIEDVPETNFMCVRPWQGAIVAPSEPPTVANAPPAADLELEWVHGYHSSSRNNLYRLGNGEIVYHTATLGVVYNREDHAQRQYFGHRRTILCLARHPEGALVATGDMGAKPEVHIWDASRAEGKMLVCVLRIKGLRRGVSAIRFSPDGKSLALVGQDESHTLFVVKDWKAGLSAGVLSRATGRDKVLDLAFGPETVATVDMRAVRFWPIASGALLAKRGILGKRGRPQPFVSAAMFGLHLVTGTASGRLYLFNLDEYKLVDKLKAHTEGAVNTLFVANRTTLVSGGKDGLVKVWNESFQCVHTVNLREQWMEFKRPSSVHALHYDVASTSVVVGTKAAEIVYFSTVDAAGSMLHAAHYRGEVWGLAANPVNPQYVTTGDDRMVRLWDTTARKCVAATKVPSYARCAAYSPDGCFLAVGMGGRLGGVIPKINGAFVVMDAETLDMTYRGQDSRRELSDIKYSPDGATLAIASHDACVYLYDVGSNYSLRAKCQGHHGAVLHVDFTADSSCLQSTSNDYELLFWSVATGAQLPSGATDLRDAEWATWTCTLGWPVQGIWPKFADGTDINAVDRSESGSLLATAADDGSVRLLKYPNPSPAWACSEYNGHGAHVTNVRWCKGDETLVSIGGDDLSVFQWRVALDDAPEPPVAEGELEADAIAQGRVPGGDAQLDDGALRADEELVALNKPVQPRRPLLENDLAIRFEEAAAPGGVITQAGQGRAWEATIKEPVVAPVLDTSEPADVIRLEWIHGYQAQRMRNSLRYLASGEVVYSVAGVGVVLDRDEHTQRFFVGEHTDDITALAVSADGTLVATGERGRSPVIYVWDATSMNVVHVLRGHTHGVTQLAFSPDGSRLVSVGRDTNHTVIVHSLKTGLEVARQRGDCNHILGVAWSPDDRTFVTVGVRHAFFWYVSARGLRRRRAVFGTAGKMQTLYSVDFLPDGRAVAGARDGSLYIWNEDRRLTAVVPAHDGPVFAVRVDSKGNLHTGGGDCAARTWAKDLSTAQVTPLGAAVRSVDGRDGMVLAGTAHSEVVELRHGAEAEPIVLVQGHFGGEVWGLATSQAEDTFATCGDDGTVRLWERGTRELVAVTDLGGPARAAAFSPDGSALAVGMGASGAKYQDDDQAGGFRVLDGRTLEVVFEGQDASGWIHDIKYSPDGKLLAMASQDCNIYLYTASEDGEYMLKATCSGHSSFVSHIDFTSDGVFIQSTSGDYELLYWDTLTGDQRVDGASLLRDSSWASWTCPLGWPVKGVWPPGADGTDVNAVDRSTSGSLVAAADDFGRVGVYRYPCVEPTSAARPLLGHSAHVTNVRWTRNDKGMVTVGGGDRAVFQWVNDGPPEGGQSSVDLDAAIGLGGRDPLADDLDEAPARSAALEAARTGMYFEIEDEAAAAEFMAVKPWFGSVIAPSDPDTRPNAVPEAELELDWVHGYAGRGMRSNVGYTATGEIVYPVAAVAVVFDAAKHEQRFFREHTDDITALAVHPAGTLVATGQAGSRPEVYIWDVVTCKVVKKLAGLHRGAISTLAFSPDGGSLITAGEDGFHTLALFDWRVFTGSILKQGSKQVMSSAGVKVARGGANKVLATAFSPDGGSMLAVGNKLVKFYNTHNMRSRPGLVTGRGKLQAFLSCAFFAGSAIVGTADGKLYEFDSGRHLMKRVDAHMAAVTSLHVTSDGEMLVSGSADGWVRTWNHELAQVKAFDAHEWGAADAAVSSVFAREDGSIVVGTRGAEVYEISPSGTIAMHTTGHFWGQTWALACHPRKHVYATAGDDGTVRTWGLEDHKQLRMVKVTGLVRCLDYSPDGARIVMGMGGHVDGELPPGPQGAWKVLDADTLEVVVERQDCNKWLQVVRYSPDGGTLAVGSHDGNIYLYNVNAEYALRTTLTGGGGGITHIDFTADSKFLQSTSTDYALKYWDVSTGSQRSNGAAELRDASWADWTSTFGWPVQGCWPRGADGTEVNAVSVAHNGRFMVAADEFGLVKLFNFPAPARDWAHDTLVGHSSHVTNCRWLAADAGVVTVGGHDRGVFVWLAMELEADEAEPASTVVVNDSAAGEYDVFDTTQEAVAELERAAKAAIEEDGRGAGASAGAGEAKAEAEAEGEEGKGEEAKGEPTELSPATAEFNLAPPTDEFTLGWVYGYQAQSVRNSLRYVNGSDIVFSAASVGVVFDPRGRTQRYNRNAGTNAGCTNDIISLAVSKDGSYVAVGEKAARPRIVVFDAASGRTVSVITGHRNGVSQLAFSHSGTKLLSVGLDVTHRVAIHHWRSATRVFGTRGSSAKIMGAAWAPGDQRFITVGSKHLFFWDKRSSHSYKRRRGMITNQGKLQTFLCAVFTRNGTAVVGAADGCLYVFKHGTRQLARVVRDAHRGPICALFCAPNGHILSGASDNVFKVWESSLASALTTVEFDAGIRSVCAAKGGSYLVGTRDSAIFQVTGGEATLLAEAHPGRHGHLGEVWGLATHPSAGEFATTGDDGTLRVWDALERRLLAKAQLGGLSRAVAYSPDGKCLALGMGGRLGGKEDGPCGEFRVFEREGLETVHAGTDGEEWIQDVRYSPDGATLAVASHDNCIYLHDTTEGYPLRAKCEGHSSFVTHVDFTADSSFLRSTSAAGELLFWEVASGERDEDGSSALADAEWDSQTCTLGWAVAGVPAQTNAVDAAHSRGLLAAVDDAGGATVFNYPTGAGAQGNVLRGHSSHVTNVRWSYDDTLLFTTGGNDRCIMQWLHV